MVKYVERFIIPGVGKLGIEDLKTSSSSSLDWLKYRLWCNGSSFAATTSLEEARKVVAYHCWQQLEDKKSNLLSKLEVVNNSLDSILARPTRISEFQVGVKE